MRRLAATSLFVLLLCRFLCPDSPSSPPLLKAGVLDLRGWAFSKSEMVGLAGEWEYYNRAFLLPIELERMRQGAAARPNYADVPALFPTDDSGYPFGFGTYRGLFLVEAGKTYGMQIPNQDTAYRLFLDGELIASDGQVGVDKASSVPSRRTQYYYWTPKRDSFELVVQVSNFHHYKGGLHNLIAIGLPEAVNEQRNHTLILTFFFLGSFLVIGLYYLILFFFRRMAPINLWFALLCFTFALRSLFIGDADISLFFPKVSWMTIARGGFLLEALLLPAFVLYAQALFPLTFPRQVYRGLLAFCALTLLIVAGLLPLPFYCKYLNMPFSYVLYIVAAYIMLRYLYFFWKGDKDSGYFALSFLLLFLMTLDPFVLTHLFSGFTYESATMSFFVYIVCQAVLLGRRNAAAYTKLDILAGNLEKEVAQRTMELEAANAALNKKNSERDFFLMSLSHEVRTPMTIILNYIKRVAAQHPGERDIVIVQRNLDKIFRDMVNIFDTLRMEKGQKILVEAARLDLGAELESLVAFYRPHAEDSGLVMSAEIEGPLVVEVGARSLDRMCGNYLENSIRYTAQGGRIRLRAYREGEAAVIRVENSGPLVEASEAARLFEAFYQGSSGKGGTGLGLFLVAEMAKEGGGRAGFEIKDAWNSFFLELPLATGEASLALGLDEAAAEGGESSRDGEIPGESQILVVEDQREIRSLLIDLLHPRYLIRTARNGREALRLLEGGLCPDLIVSDVMMEEVDGFEMLRALDGLDSPEGRDADGKPRKTPLIFVTAMSSAAAKMPPSPGRQVRVIIKPFTDRQLLSSIAALIELSPSGNT